MYGYGGQWDAEGFMSRPFMPESPTPKPSTERTIDCSPDSRPSASRSVYDNEGGNIRCLLDVRGLGVLVFRVSEGHADGRLVFEGVSTFSHRQLLIENEIDDPRLARLE